MLKNFTVSLLIFFASTVFCGEIVNQSFLALYNSDDPATPDLSNTLIHKKIEVIFNFYGQKIDYLDISKGITQDQLTKDFVKRYKGIILWFRFQSFETPQKLISFLEIFADQKKKFMVFGEWPFLKNKTGQETAANIYSHLFAQLGLHYENIYSGNSIILKLTKNFQKDQVEFERKLENEILEIDLIKNTSTINKTWLTINNQFTHNNADVIIVGKKLLYAQQGYNLFENPTNEQSEWRINPFLALEEFLEINTRLYPILDITTLNGKRIWFNHIDGDGILNVGRSNQEKKCGEIIYQQILKKYDVPHTVSVIEAEIAPEGKITPNIKQMLQNIFELPNIEIASHTYSHPLSWSKNPSLFERENYLGKGNRDTGPILSFPQKNYHLDYKREIQESITFINKNLVPTNKKAKIILWSGSCRPPAEALQVAQENNYLNMNGGDSRMDRFFPSYSGLSPLYRKLENKLQVYSANGNENIYTNLWEGPYEGFSKVIDTFRNTESPIRIRPVNIYYHFYSGEYLASLEALKAVYDWVQKQNYNPIFASDYIQMVQDFESAKISEIRPEVFEIENQGKIRTVKFKTKLYPDYKNSKNIIGHQFFQNYLWIYLGSDTHSKISLTGNRATTPHLISSVGIIDSFKIEHHSILIKGRSYVPGELLFFDGKVNKSIQIKRKGIINLEVKV